MVDLTLRILTKLWMKVRFEHQKLLSQNSALQPCSHCIDFRLEKVWILRPNPLKETPLMFSKADQDFHDDIQGLFRRFLHGFLEEISLKKKGKSNKYLV